MTGRDGHAMTTMMQRSTDAPGADNTGAPVVEIVIPVHNEEHDLAPSVRRLHDYLVRTFPLSFLITIADNASTDGTWLVACALEHELANVRATYHGQKGRGRALHAVWSSSNAVVVCYMDVDLSTDLAALLPLVAPLVSGHSDVAIGTRLSPSSRVTRGPKREVISRIYNAILRTALATRFSDAQCGFKAIRTDRARELLPLVRDTGWFFDTELLVLAERSGMRIHEVPVDWVDDPDSRVDIVSTAVADLRGIVRLGRDLARGRIPLTLTRQADSPSATMFVQLVRFCAIGAVSTVAYVVLYLLLRSAMSAPGANALALLLTAIANTAANRVMTFGVRGSRARVRHQIQGLVVFGIGLALSTTALAALHHVQPNAGRAVELTALIVANLAASLIRFLLFRGWVFRAARHTPRSRSDQGTFHPPALTTTTEETS
ncbi:MAG: hypothetical protein QOH29_85 [Actinomycetota bacterium]|nr:hypothetical protein [Actinomycetota bacterium]